MNDVGQISQFEHGDRAGGDEASRLRQQGAAWIDRLHYLVISRLGWGA